MENVCKAIDLVERTYSTQEVLAICKISRRILTQAFSEGRIPGAKKEGRGIRYPASWVEKWRIPESYIRLSAYAKKREISREAVHKRIQRRTLEGPAKQSFAGVWWIADIEKGAAEMALKEKIRRRR